MPRTLRPLTVAIECPTSARAASSCAGTLRWRRWNHPGEDPPHAYIPTGPVEAAPYLGYCPPEVRQEAFSAVLEGVETGTYDNTDRELVDRLG
jgi:hypothetical protein